MDSIDLLREEGVSFQVIKTFKQSNDPDFDTRPHGVRHLMAGYDLSTDRLYGHIVTRKDRTAFLAFVRYLRSLHPPEVRIAIVLDNFSPHLCAVLPLCYLDRRERRIPGPNKALTWAFVVAGARAAR